MPRSSAAKPRARLKERRMAGSRQEILDATRAVLPKVGPVKVTLELVAAELGMSKQALYYYYPSRSALLFELVVEELLTVANQVHVACAAAPGGASALEALLRTYIGYFLPKLELHRTITLQF